MNRIFQGSLIATILACSSAHATYKPLPADATAQCPAHGWFFHDHFCQLGTRSGGALDCVACPAPSDTDFAPDQLIRGGEPTKEGIDFLKRRGVGLIIDLRSPAEDRRQMERKETAAQGISYVNLPLQMDAESVGQNVQLVTQALNTISQFRKSQPDASIYIHCQRGEDRTGLLVAAYRALSENASDTAVEREMNQHYFNWHYDGLTGTWERLKPVTYPESGR